MARTILITGATMGMGKATADLLRGKGHRVIGVSRKGAEIEADLGTPAGRAHMVAEAERLAPGGLDGVLACAGMNVPDKPRETVALDYFGAVATLEGLRPLLARSPRPRAVAVSSTAGILATNEDVVKACLAGDELAALTAVAAGPATAYSDAKRALSRWLRRAAVRPEWAGAGILLNGVAPGAVRTELSRPFLDDPQWADVIKQINPIAVQGYAEPEEVAELIEFLLGVESHYLVGQMIYLDGGTDAIIRPDSF